MERAVVFLHDLILWRFVVAVEDENECPVLSCDEKMCPSQRNAIAPRTRPCYSSYLLQEDQS